MRKIAFVVVALAASVFGPASSNGQGIEPLPSDPRAFTEAFVRLCRQAAPSVKLTIVGPLSLQIDAPQGLVSAHLDTVYSICRRDPAGCGDFLSRMVDLTTKGFASAGPAATLSQVRVTVRPSRFLDETAEAGGKNDPIAEPLVGDLWVIGVRDQPTSIATLDQSDLEALKLDAAGALAAGEHNIAVEFGEKLRSGAAQAQPGEGVAGMKGNDYLASLLALPDLWAPLAERFDGQLYVAAPASDYVIFADARAKGNAVKMANYAAILSRGARRPVSTEVFEWTPTGWKVVDPGKAQ